MTACVRWIAGFVVFALLGLPLVAQQPQGASFQVTVEDEQSLVIVGAQVTLRQLPTGQSREVTTNKQGVADLEGLPQGEYSLVVSSPGFRNDERRVTIAAQPPRPLRVRLAIEVTEVVAVEERRRPLPKLQEVDQNADAVNIDDDVLTGIPMSIRGDRIIGFLSRFMNPAAGTPSIVMDGQEVTRLDLPPRAIDEIVVNKNPYSAEYRRPGRSRVEVISQDGSEDHHHADATFVFTNSALSARNPFAREKQDVTEMVGETGFSGPLPSGNGSYLFASEIGGDRVGAVVNAVTPEGPVTTFVPEKQRETFWTGRLDLAPSDRVDVTFRYEYEKESERNGGVGGLVLPELAVNGDTSKQDFFFGLDHILSANFIHVPRVKISYENGSEGGDPRRGPRLIVNGAFIGGVVQNSLDLRLVQADIQDTGTLRRGAHTFSFGGRFNPSFYSVSDRSNFGGTFEFANLEAFSAGRPYVFRINEGTPAFQYGLQVADAHFQDEIKLRPDFTLMLGARYDWESIINDGNNVAPRIAFAFAPGDRKTALRGGTGIFYQRLGRIAYERVEVYGGSKIRTLVYTNPAYPNATAGSATVPTPSVYRFAPTMTTPYETQTSFAVDRQLSAESSFSAEYLHLRGSNSFRVRDLNAPQPGTGVRPDPAFQNVIQIEPTGKLRSNALHLTFNGEVGQFEGHVAYTYSRSNNDVTGSGAGGAISFSLPSNNLDLRQEWGRADFDRRHRFSMAGVYELPKEFEVGFIMDAFSGLPYEITTGFDDDGNSIANDRPAGVLRNAGQGPRFVQLDVRFQRAWQVKRPLDPEEDPAEIEVFVDLFNVLNTINYTEVIGVQSSPRFGQPTFAEKARLIQFGISYSF